MRAIAALLLLASCCVIAASHDVLQNRVFAFITDKLTDEVGGTNQVKWQKKAINCAAHLGIGKCIKVFSVWRAEKALSLYAIDKNTDLNVTKDLERFDWENFSNTTDDELGDRLADGAAKLLRYKSLSLSMVPGYKLELDSKRSGTLSVDVCAGNQEESRGSGKKALKRFYAIVPLLLVPGLIMAAILPFMLPALKMMTIGVGMLNQMALTGAIFTLLRNNAFNDKYTKKIVYVNHGYKKEKHAPVYVENESNHYYNYDDKYSEAGFEMPVKVPEEWLNDNYAGDSNGFNPNDYGNRRHDELKLNESQLQNTPNKF